MSASRRFDQYMAHLSQGLGHADRHAGLKGYCTGLMLPLARKIVEPMAARFDPLHASVFITLLRKPNAPMRNFCAGFANGWCSIWISAEAVGGSLMTPAFPRRACTRALSGRGAPILRHAGHKQDNCQVGCERLAGLRARQSSCGLAALLARGLGAGRSATQACWCARGPWLCHQDADCPAAVAHPVVRRCSPPLCAGRCRLRRGHRL